ncbi:hypothetical protein [Neorhizobium galegae]|uniref:hypothetical protein n=1 Tax=Neorhizobium galegae TaxID=399 RepID=UPI001F32B483|nr:hypothetical protein [Neorhizobium galegae]UIK08975.1 hypothetical protein LZK81_29215 [Neorhizobium galegae]
MLDLVKGLTHLTHLNASGLDLDDADVSNLAAVGQKLVTLELGLTGPREGHQYAATQLTGSIVQWLEALTSLRSLSLRGIPVSDDDVNSTNLWKKLSRLDLSGTAVSDKGVTSLASAFAILELSLSRTEITDEAAAAVFSRPRQAVDVSWTQVSQTGIVKGQSPEALQKGNFAGLDIDDSFASWLRAATSLREIDLSHTRVGDDVAGALGDLRFLEQANLSNTHTTDEGICRLMNAPIRNLEIYGRPVAAQGLTAIAQNRTLKSVKVTSDADWTGLAEINAELDMQTPERSEGRVPQSLRRLSLRGMLTSSLADELGNSQNLKSLGIDSIGADAGFESNFFKLEDFFAENAGLDDPRISVLLAKPSIAGLYLSGNPLGKALGGQLSNTIHTLELRETQVSDAEIPIIGKLPRLHCIDLPHTRVTAKGIAKLARMSVNLQSLALDGTQVDSESVGALALAPRLLELYLYGDEVDTRTIALLGSVRLRELHLLGTNISDDAVPHLAAIAGLRFLSLDANLSDDALLALRSLRPHLLVSLRR